MFEYSTNYTEAYPTEKETLLPPPTKLGYHSNNKYAGFPPLMSDGRTITASWQPEALVNEELIKTIGIHKLAVSSVFDKKCQRNHEIQLYGDIH